MTEQQYFVLDGRSYRIVKITGDDVTCYWVGKPKEILVKSYQELANMNCIK